MARKSAVLTPFLDGRFVGPSLAFAIALTSHSAFAQNATFGASGSASTDSGVQTSSSAAAAPAAATTPGTSEVPPDEEWADRDRRLGESNSLGGGTGLLHMQTAQLGAPGQLRIGFTTEYFSAGFLCTSDYPCTDPRNPSGAKITSDTLNHIGGTLTLNVTILKWLEGYAGTSAYANSDDSNNPTLLQVLGDTDFGLKAAGAISKVFHVGGFAELWLINGTGSVGLDGGGTSFKFGPVGTMDLRPALGKEWAPRVSLQADYMFDNSGDVLSQHETNIGGPSTRIERFGLGVNRVDHVDIGLGVESLFVEGRVRPFVEYNMLIPSNRQGYACHANNASSDQCLANDNVVPSKLTLGSRFFPWKRGFSLLAAFDIGISGVSNFVEELQPQAPWTLYIGAGWAIDTQDRPPVERIKNVEKIVDHNPNAGRIKGFVHEKGQSAGIATAIINWENHPEITALASGSDGRFVTQDLPAGQYNFLVKSDGYKDGQCSGTLAAPAAPPPPGQENVPGSAPPGIGGMQEIQIDCALESLPRVGTVVGHVKDADSNSGVGSAKIEIKDAAGKSASLVADDQGNFRAEGVSPGTASFTVASDAYMASTQPADIKPRIENNIDLVIHKRPKKSLVDVGKDEIKIKQQIQFATDSATILPESLQLMTEIADAFVRNPWIKRVEVQGHTDNTGTADHNKILSEQRADAVREWLISHGVGADRLVSRGYGQTKPLVPNVTTANKARNRRVQFIILDKDTPPAASPKASVSPKNK
jgi:outer membrane protein OmpA-like peptidoglycan-associated protein